MINGYEYVDLGLPSGTLWASYDIGATKVGEFGDFFMWGEVEPKDPDGDWGDDDHKYIIDDAYVKYNDSDRKRTLDPEDDAASVLWGNDWKIPSCTDWRELMMFCDLELKGDAIVFIGPNGNELHFTKYLYEVYEDSDFSCSWWSSELDESDDDVVYFYVDKDKDEDPECDVFTCHRACLIPIRPVSKIRTDLNYVLPEEDEVEESTDDTYEEPSASSFSMNNEDKVGYNTLKENVYVSSPAKFDDNYSRKNTYIKDGYEKEKTSPLSYILFAIAILMLMFAIFNL
ncbi:MAG: hypothetical protein Q4B61_07395 [Bacteroidales bacterium]|nr:hypothetical protein [Bacteroidales bacterium]